MVNLSGTAGPISIKYGQEGAEPAELMPTQTNGEERLLRYAGWKRGEETRREEGRRGGEDGEERGGGRREEEEGWRAEDEERRRS